MDNKIYSLAKDEFIALTAKGNLIPVYREIFSDMETPVCAYLKLGGGAYSFLLESVEGGEKWGRYTFIGAEPAVTLTYSGGAVTITRDGTTQTRKAEGDPLDELKKIMSAYKPVIVPGLPRFSGGAVGYLSYDSARFFERLPETVKDELGTPDAVFMITGAILVFDNIAKTIKVVANAHVGADGPEKAYEQAIGQIDALMEKIRQPAPKPKPKGNEAGGRIDFTGNMDKDTFERNVESAKKYIREGDIFQVVLAQRLHTKLNTHPFQVYRALRTVNPSPYMYYIDMGATKIVGASPESLARVEDGIIEVRPIAGTRPRGADEREDQQLEEELLADKKERSEHIMLVDLGRNDVGRVSVGGSVEVNELMSVEKYSHVMHIVSNVKGKLRPGMDAYDALRATFPAGTLSGAPKIRAMEIIEEMEGTRRGVYGGAVGYFSFSGNMDMAIAIRTMHISGSSAYLGVGAGIVADSVPELEYQETINKGKAIVKAVELAEKGLDS